MTAAARPRVLHLVPLLVGGEAQDEQAAAALNQGAEPMGSVGLVVGATVGDAAERTGTDLTAVNGPLLAPGVGAQGAGERELAAGWAVVHDDGRAGT